VRHLLIALILTAHYCLEVAICLPWTLGLRLFVRASAWWPLDWGLRFPPKLVALAGPWRAIYCNSSWQYWGPWVSWPGRQRTSGWRKLVMANNESFVEANIGVERWTLRTLQIKSVEVLT